MQSLNDSKSFLRSIECRIAEEYLISFKFTDISRLEAAQQSSDNHVFDSEIQYICKQLSLSRRGKGVTGGNEAKTVPAPRPPVVQPPAEPEEWEEEEVPAVSREEEVPAVSREEEVPSTTANAETTVAVEEEEDEVDLT